MTDATLSPVVANILGIMATAVGLGLIWVLIKASSWISEKINSVKADWESRLSDANLCQFINTENLVMDKIQNIVDALNETFKKELAEKSETGKITVEDGKTLLNKAIELTLAEVSESQQEILETGIGDLEEWIRTQVENAVTRSKQVTSTDSTETTSDTVNS